MKYIHNNYTLSGLKAFCLLFVAALLFACNNDDNPLFENNDKPITVSSIHLQDAEDTVLDREVEFARLGQLIRLQGSGFVGVKEVLINGENAYLNPTLMSDNSMILRVPSDAETTDCPEEYRDKIILKKANISHTHIFDIRAAAPSISRVSHTMPQAGEEITIHGNGLVEIYSITFPGNIVVTDGIESDEDGKWCTVTVPSGITEGGSLLVLGSNGGAYSPPYFNFRQGLLHNFDDVSNWSWGGGDISEDLNVLIPASGDGPKSQGNYRSSNGSKAVVKAGSPKYSFGWANNGIWSSVLNETVIPPTTPASEVGVQMDIYFEGTWNSSYIRIVVADGWGSTRYCMRYIPYMENMKRVPFENPGCWFTITLPFSDSPDFEELTFQDVLNVVNSASYAQWGPWFENDDYKAVEGAEDTAVLAAEDTDVIIYFDNMRVVPLVAPSYSDFGDEE